MTDETTTTKKKKKKAKKPTSDIKKKVAKKISRGEDIGSPDAMIVRSQSSVEIERDAKGNVKFKIKVYLDDPMLAAAEALKVKNLLDEKLGLTEENSEE